MAITQLHQQRLQDQTNAQSMARQSIQNGNFDVWQRGTTFTPLVDGTITYLADRWRDNAIDDGGTLPTLTRSRQIITSGDIPNAFYYSRLNTNGAGSGFGTNAMHPYYASVENGNRFLCGLNKKVTLSFWAKSDIVGKKLGIYMVQYYGTGGSPSTNEIIVGRTFDLTSTWTKYTHTYTTNTLVGKTFGTNNDDIVIPGFMYMWGSTTGTTFMGTGVAETYVGSGNIDIAQVQLCAGDEVLPFQPKSFNQELFDCKRYYQKSYSYATAPGTATAVSAAYFNYGNATSGAVYGNVQFAPSMRVAPTVFRVWDSAGTLDKVYKGALGRAVDYVVSYTGDSYKLIGCSDATSSATLEFQWDAFAEL